MIVRFIIAAIFIGIGIFIFAAATLGVFKFKYVLNRMHIAAQSDTLGILCVGVGASILTGFTFATLKIIAVVILFWLTSPVASHLIAKMERASIDKKEKENFEKVFEKGVDSDE